MKKLITLLFILSFQFCAAQQWSGNQNETDDIHRSGGVGIGTPTFNGVKMYINHSVTTTPSYGSSALFAHASTTHTTGALAKTQGGWILSLNSGPATLNESIGLFCGSGNESSASGTVQDAYGLKTWVQDGAGTVNNGYGVYIEKVEATNSWGIYQDGSISNNYFAGNIGIGTDLPSIGNTIRSSEGDLITPKLHIYSNTNNVHPTLHISAENQDEAVVLLTENSSNNGYGAKIYYEGSGNNFYNVAIGDAGTWIDRFTIDRYGKVGIGTTTPTSTLDVNGPMTYDGSLSSHKSSYTKVQLATHDWSGSHAVLFNAYKSIGVNGSLISTGNTKYANDVGSYSGGAGGIIFNGNGGSMYFCISPNSTGIDTDVNWGGAKMYINRSGQVGIGTTTVPTGYHFAVDGKAIMEEVEVAVSTNWPDYVFSDTYELIDLSEVSDYIEENHHLPGIPTSEEVQESGIKLGEMNAKLLEKIEELTLYQIQLLEKLVSMNERISELEKNAQ